ncbi:MAG TPA: alcohol dehydrogenase catalytic domain-containing protein [Kofleriaceae bacterium]|nr:alcohol dehydrogenase catalytic domain-containing protein [Kofleriaceae bacterium]
MTTVGDDDVAIALEAVQGNAGIGRVVEVGARAAGLADKRVLVGPIDPCGECEVCRRGGAAVCPMARRRTAWPSRIVAAVRWVIPLDAGLDARAPEGAAIAGDVALAYTLYARTGAAPREPVVVVGAAPVTRFLVEILGAKGLTFAVVASGAEAWTAWLATKGAAVAADATALEAVFATSGLARRPWRVIATSADSVATAAALAGPRATLTVLAPIAALPGELAAREVTVITVAGAHPDLVVEAAAMCVKGEIDLAGGTAREPTADHRAVVEPR